MEHEPNSTMRLVSCKHLRTPQGKTMIDYANPCMMAENALENAHQAMLDKDYDVAIHEALSAMVETKLMINAIKHMKEQEHALRNQTTSV